MARTVRTRHLETGALEADLVDPVGVGVDEVLCILDYGIVIP